MPGFIAPQLCELVTAAPNGGDWVHEPKLDGYRMPTLVIEAGIASWTSDNLVRQASYKGLREDKKAREVIVEFAHKLQNG
ncbi:MAG TPA: hypothetical protein VMF67_08690 [Rhizomicrobium sp.]|nr:hypothetical protein [Rhizomicrobium sp.]